MNWKNGEEPTKELINTFTLLTIIEDKKQTLKEVKKKNIKDNFSLSDENEL